VVIINLQATPDDNKCDLRIFGKCDAVFKELLSIFNLPILEPPIWYPRDRKKIKDIPSYVDPYYIEAAKRLDQYTAQREEDQKKIQKETARRAKEKKKADKQHTKQLLAEAKKEKSRKENLY